jgi:agmatinase
MKISFADNSEDAHIFFLGVPYDSTTSFRPGTRFAAGAIRQASYNFETYDCFLKKEVTGMTDIGDTTPTISYGDLTEELSSILRTQNDRFPIIAGGEHSITPIVARNLKRRFSNLSVVTIDAHMDFRKSYMGSENSHACASRRVSEIVGIDRLMLIGLRSFSREEDEESRDLEYYTSFETRKRLGEICDRLRELDQVYLSIDMDGFDPSFAPGVGNPEPYGLRPEEVREIITAVSGKLVGCDIVELCPPYDNGNTACLAAKLVQEISLRL